MCKSPQLVKVCVSLETFANISAEVISVKCNAMIMMMIIVTTIYRIVGDFAGSLMTRRSPHPLRLENFGPSVVTWKSLLTVKLQSNGEDEHLTTIATSRGEGDWRKHQTGPSIPIKKKT